MIIADVKSRVKIDYFVNLIVVMRRNFKQRCAQYTFSIISIPEIMF